MKRILLSLLLAPALVMGQEPDGYYKNCEGAGGKDLLMRLYETVGPHTKVTYDGLWNVYKDSDVRPNGTVWDMYSTKEWRSWTKCGNYKNVGDCLNREHSFPKSWWGGGKANQYSDAFHLYPTDGKVNNQRSNYPFGECAGGDYLPSNGSVRPLGRLGNSTFPGFSGEVFEPDDQYKGDFARTYFYMVTCYQDLTWKYTYMVSQNLYPTLNQWSIDLLMKWHREDPVSEKERDRNEAVFGFQNNRNPFIDRPELAEYLWGLKKGEAYTPGEVVVPPVGDPELIAPQPGMTLDFGEVALGKTYTARLLVSGKHLPAGYVSASVYTADKDMFSSATSQIPVAKVNSDDGYWLEVTYKPTVLGSHNSRLLLSGDFGSVGVALRGECLPVPQLSALTATAATNIESDRYMANWSTAPEDIIDYYMVTRTRYVGSDVFTEELPAEDNFLEIVGFDQSDSESYSVQAVRLGYRSPMSNVVFVDHSGVADVAVEQPLVVQTFPGFVRFICSQPQSNCRVYDISGRQIYVIDEVYQNFDLELPLGIYLITTDEHPTPVRVYIR